jgi:hypothetical protein
MRMERDAEGEAEAEVVEVEEVSVDGLRTVRESDVCVEAEVEVEVEVLLLLFDDARENNVNPELGEPTPAPAAAFVSVLLFFSRIEFLTASADMKQ